MPIYTKRTQLNAGSGINIVESIPGSFTITNTAQGGGGGGGGVLYYLNQAVAGASPLPDPNTKQLLKTIQTNATQTTVALIKATPPAILDSFITPIGDPNITAIPAGIWEFNVFLSINTTAVDEVVALIKLYRYDGTITTQIGQSSEVAITNGNIPTQYTLSVAIPQTAINSTDRIYVELLGQIKGNNNHSITVYYDGIYPSHTHTTIPYSFVDSITAGSGISVTNVGNAYTVTNVGALLSGPNQTFTNVNTFAGGSTTFAGSLVQFTNATQPLFNYGWNQTGGTSTIAAGAVLNNGGTINGGTISADTYTNLPVQTLTAGPNISLNSVNGNWTITATGGGGGGGSGDQGTFIEAEYSATTGITSTDSDILGWTSVLSSGMVLDGPSNSQITASAAGYYLVTVTGKIRNTSAGGSTNTITWRIKNAASSVVLDTFAIGGGDSGKSEGMRPDYSFDINRVKLLYLTAGQAIKVSAQTDSGTFTPSWTTGVGVGVPTPAYPLRINLTKVDLGAGSVSQNYLTYYDTAGTYSWTKPAGIKQIRILAHGPGGGGGGGGAVTTNSPVTPGQGGGRGDFIDITINADEVPVSVPITIPAGGLGGAGATPGLNGIAAPGQSRISNYTTFGDVNNWASYVVVAQGGSGGQGGGSTAGSVSGGRFFPYWNSTDSAVSAISSTGVNTGTNTNVGSSAGSNGGGATSGGTPFNGANGNCGASTFTLRTLQGHPLSINAPTGLASASTAGGAGGNISRKIGFGIPSALISDKICFGVASGGGGCSAPGFRGGAGGQGVGGGGGGGGGSGCSGAGGGQGGNGSDGWMVIIAS